MFDYDETFYVEQAVGVSAERAWKMIAEPGGLMNWHPFMEKHVADCWDGVESTDYLTCYSGFEYNRTVTKWIDGVGYDLKVTENGKREYKASWRIIPVDETHCASAARFPLSKNCRFPFAGPCWNSK